MVIRLDFLAWDLKNVLSGLLNKFVLHNLDGGAPPTEAGKVHLRFMEQLNYSLDQRQLYGDRYSIHKKTVPRYRSRHPPDLIPAW